MTVLPRASTLKARPLASFCALALLAVMSCVGGDATAPAPEGGVARGISFVPIFPQLVGGPAAVTALGVQFDRVRVVLRRSDGSIALDTLVTFPEGADAISVTLDVPLSPGTPPAGEPLKLNLAYMNAAGETVFTGGPIDVLAKASAMGQAGPVQVPVKYSGPGAGATAVIVSPRSLSALEGDPFAFTARATDAGGQTLANTPIVWTSLDPARATITSPTAGSGTAGNQRGPVRLIAQLLTGPADTVTLNVGLKARTIAAVSGTGQSAAVGGQLAQPIVVRVTASDGVAVQGTAVTFAASGGGSVGSTTATTDVNGLAQTTWRLGPTVGAQSATASAAGLTGSPVTFSANGISAAATKLAITNQPTSATAGFPIGAITVVAQDAADNTFTGFTGPVTIAFRENPGGSTLSGTTTVNAVAGVATFSGISLNKAGTGYSLLVSAAGLPSVPTNRFDIVAAAATGIAVASGEGQSSQEGTALPQPIVIQVTDAGGNAVAVVGRTVSFAVATGGGSVSPTSATTNAQGQASTIWTLGGTVGTQSLHAMSAGLTPSPLTVTATGTGGGPTQLAFIVQPSNSVAGASIAPAVKVEARDSTGALAGSFAGNVTIALDTNPGGSTLSGTVTVAAVGGVATFSNLSLNKVGTGYKLKATSGTLVLATSAMFNVTPANAAILTYQTPPSNAVAGVAIAPAIVVVAKDGFGNDATGFTGNVALSLQTNPGGATLSGTTTVAAVAGTATFSNVSLDKAASGYQMGASASGTIGIVSGPFTISAASAHHLAFTVQPTGLAAGAAITPAVQVSAQDAFGNLASTFTGNVTVAIGNNPGGATLSGTTTVAAVAGVASFANLSLNNGGVGYTLTASSPPLTGATSAAFTIGSGAGGINSWVNAAGGAWSTPANWSLGRAPLAGDTVIIALHGTYTVTLDVNANISFLYLGGGSGSQTLSMNSRSLQVDVAALVDMVGAIAATNSTILGAGDLVNYGSLTITGSAIEMDLTNLATVIAQGTSVVDGALYTDGYSVIRVQGSPAGMGDLVVTNGFDNFGLIELTEIGTAAGARLSVTSGTLFNHEDIYILAGLSGSRGIYAEIDNQGTIHVETPTTIDKPAAQHSNSGVIYVNDASLTFAQSGASPSFTNSGEIDLLAGSTMFVQGGTFDHSESAGMITGSTLSLSSLTFNLTGLLATSSVGLEMQDVTVNGSGSLLHHAATTSTWSSVNLNVPLSNQGNLRLQGTSFFNGTYTSGSGSGLRVQGASGYGVGRLTVANGFTNNGTIELTETSSLTPGVVFTVTNGTLTNASGRQILALAGFNGSRQLEAEVVNNGIITLSSSQGLNLPRPGSDHVNGTTGTINVNAGQLTITQTSGTTPTFTNNGTVNIASGRTVTINGGETFNGATGIVAGTGTLNLLNQTAYLAPNFANTFTTINLSATTLNGPGTFTNDTGRTMTVTSSTINLPFVNKGTLIIQNASSITGSFTSQGGSTLRVRGGPVADASLAMSSGFTNNGTIELTSTDVLAASLTVAGTLTNAAGATINAMFGAGGARTLDARLVNSGTLSVSGAFAAADGLDLTTASAAHINSGTIDLSGGSLNVNQSGTSPSFVNAGTVTMAGTNRLNITNGSFSVTGGSITGFQLRLTSMTWDLPASYTTVVTQLVLTSTTVNGPGTLTLAAPTAGFFGDATFNAPVVNTSGIVIRGGSTVIGDYTSGPASSLGVTSSTGADAVLTIVNGFTNNGPLSLSSTGSAAGAALNVTNGSLTNASGRVIDVQTGAGGPRELNAQIVNQGTLQVTGSQGLTVGRASSDHTNSGSVDVSGGNLTILQSGTTPSFTNSGAITIAASRQLAVTPGTFNHEAGGTIGGAGGLSLSGTALNLNANLTTPTGTSVFSGASVNGSGTLTNAGTILLENGTINTSLANQGTLTASMTSEISGNVTTAVGSILRVEGNVAGNAILGVENGFTNNGLIELTSSGASNGATLTVTSGTLTNASGATFATTIGAGGARTLTAQFDNQGTFDLNASSVLTINKPGGSYSNSGTINVTGSNMSFSTGTAPSFTNTGTINVAAPRVFFVHGGTFNHTSGTITGAGAAIFDEGIAMTLQGTFAIAQAVFYDASVSIPTSQTITPTGRWSLAGSTVSGIGTITNQSINGFELFGSTISNPLVNQGRLTAGMTVAIDGSFTAAPGSTLEIGREIASALTITSAFTNQGTISLTSSSLPSSSELIVPAGMTNGTDGTIESLDGTGGARTITGDVVNDGSLRLTPGAAGTLTLAGNLSGDGEIVMDLGGLAAETQYDRLTVTGSLTLGNALLTVNLFGGFTPAVGDTFTIMDYASVVGGFEANLPPGMTYQLNPTSLVLSR